LHHRATLGEALTPEESAALVDWYARLDADEAALFRRTERPAQVVLIQQQIDVTVAQLEVISQHIRETMQVNEQLRQEIADLHSQLIAYPPEYTQ